MDTQILVMSIVVDPSGACDAVYRNPEGTRENNDEYIIVFSGSATSFDSAY